MTPWRRRLRRVRLGLTLLLGSLLILGAVLMGVVQLALPLVDQHPERVAAFLSERMHRPVSIDTVQAQWEGAGPVLRLSGVHIAGATPEQPPLVIPEAQLSVDASAWAKKNRRWNEFRLSGLDLHLDHAADGSWQLRGFAAGQAGEGGDNPLLALGALVVSNSRIALTDAAHGLDLDLHADELRLLNWGEQHTVLGLVRAAPGDAVPVQLVARWDAASRSGELYLGSDRMDLGRLLDDLTVGDRRLAGGHGRLRVWASFADARLQSAHADVDLADLAVRVEPVGRDAAPEFARLARLRGLARWQRDGQGWRLDLAGLRADAPDRPAEADSTLQWQQWRDGDQVHYSLSAPQLDIGSGARLAVLAGLAPPAVAGWLAEAAPGGRLSEVSAQWRDRSDYRLDATLTGLSLKPSGKKPGIDHLDAHLFGDAQALALELPPQTATVQFPALFRKPFAFARLAGSAAVYRSEADDAWRLEADALELEGEGYGLRLAGAMDFPDAGGRPRLDLGVAVTHADVPAAKLFWPIGVMPPPAVAWLDRALVSGQVSHGRAVVRGDLKDWPFRDNEGRFDAFAEVDDATLDYHADWPRAEHVDATAEFLGSSMHVEVSGAQALGATVNQARADIADFHGAVLDLSVQGGGSGPQLLSFLNASPVGKRYADALKGVKVGGKGSVDFNLRLPLGPDLGESVLDGNVTLADADLDHTGYGLHFDKAAGRVHFGGQGFSAGPLATAYAGHPASLSLAVGDAVADASHAFEARLASTMPAADLFAALPTLKPLWPYFPGSSAWQVGLDIGQASGSAAGPITLRLHSDLIGTRIALPEPLAKTEAEPLALDIAVPLPFEGSTLDLGLGDLLRLRARLPTPNAPLGLALAFGDQPPQSVPAEGLAVSGRAAALDLVGWVGVGVGGSDGVGLRSVNLGIDEAHLGDRTLRDLGLVIEPQPAATTIRLSGPDVQGHLLIPNGAELARQGISAEFERLYYPAPPPDEDEDAPGALTAVTPAAIPPLHVRIADFHLGHASFGEARLEAAPTPQGLHFSQVQTTSPNVEMHAEGDWIGSVLGSRSDFSIDLSAQNLGRMLDALGYAGVVDGGETHAKIRASWLGSPSSFALAKLDGTLKLSVSEGRILEVEPGMGRLLGLFSIREIPRRLALDFGDFFRTGFTFKSIAGEFLLREGSAFTTDLRITSPSADIRINGRTGLKDKDYDQQMVVVPHVGGTLPVVGAVVGGPAGAAAGLAVQTLFNRAINQVTTARYHVSGSWEKPVITLVSREGGKRETEGKGAGEKKKEG